MFIIEVDLIRWHQLKIYLSDCCWDLELNQFILLQQMNHNNRLKLKPNARLVCFKGSWSCSNLKLIHYKQ